MLPFVGGNYALTVGSEIAIFVIFAASLHFLMSVGGLASFGHAAYFGLGAYGVAFLAKMAGLPMIVSLLLGPLLGCLGAAVFGFFCVQLSGVYFAMLTLAFAQIVWSIAFQWVAVTGGDNGILGVWPEKWAAGPASFYWLSLAVAALAVVILRIIVFSPFGYALRATRDSLLRSEAIGINGKRMQWTAFVIAGTVAGVAGALFAYLKGSVFPDNLGIALSVDALVMVLLGGVETVSGAVIGAIVYKALNIWLVSQTDWSKLVLGGFIVLIVVAFPKGIVGTLETLISRRQILISENRRSPPPRRDRRMSTPQTLLSVEGLTKSYGGVHAVRDVSFALKAGEILALIGPNGAGKSTCFDMLNGQNTPDSGRITSARAGYRRPQAARDLAARRRPHLSDHRDIPDHDRARERAGRAGVLRTAALQSLRLDAAIRARRGRAAARSRRHGRLCRAALRRARLWRSQAAGACGRARQPAETAADGRADRRHGPARAHRSDARSPQGSRGKNPSACSSPNTTWTWCSNMPTASWCSTAAA